MGVRVMIPTALRHYVGNQESLQMQGATVGEVIGKLVDSHQALRRHLLNEEGKLRNFVNVYVNDEDIRYLRNAETPVKDGDTVTIVPAIAGGVTRLQQFLH